VSQFLAGKGISALDHPPYSPDLAPADFWLFSELKNLLKAKSFTDVESIKLSVKKFLQTFLFRILKTVLNNSRNTGNFVKTWREITLKKCRLLISAALKIIFLISHETYFPELVQ
jgi:transposase